MQFCKWKHCITSKNLLFSIRASKFSQVSQRFGFTGFLKQNNFHCFAHYHSEDAAICFFQSASQQRGMKRAGSQRELRLPFIQGKKEPLQRMGCWCVPVCVLMWPLKIKQSPCTSSVCCFVFERL